MAIVREIGGTAHLYQDSDLRALATSLAVAAAARFGALRALAGTPEALAITAP